LISWWGSQGVVGLLNRLFESVRALLLELNVLSIRSLIAFNGFLTRMRVEKEVLRYHFKLICRTIPSPDSGYGCVPYRQQTSRFSPWRFFFASTYPHNGKFCS
jgi:hypothetical protein